MDVLNIPLTPRSDFWRLRNTLISFEMDSNYSRSFRMVLIALCHFAEMCVPYLSIRKAQLSSGLQKKREPGIPVPSQLGTSRKDYGISRKDFEIKFVQDPGFSAGLLTHLTKSFNNTYFSFQNSSVEAV